MEEHRRQSGKWEMVPKFFIFGLFLFFLSVLINPVIISGVHAASAPNIITYQGKLLVSGKVATTTQNIYFILYNASTGGSVVYTASGTVGVPQPVAVYPIQGLFTVNFGDTGTNGLDPNIFANDGSVYLEVRIGADTLTPRKRITAAPYAFNAKYLDGYGASTGHPASSYIPVSDASGNFQFNSTTVSTSTINDLIVGNSVALPANSIGPAELANTTVTATTYGAVDKTITFTVDADGRLTYASSTLISINANQITAGTISTVMGGTGQNSSAWTGFVKVTGGTWATSTINLASSDVSGMLAVGKGGTGADSSGWTGIPWVNGGVWANSTSIGVAFGGTGATSVGSAGTISYSNGTNYAFTAVGSAGEILQSAGAGTPVWVSTSSLGIGGSGTVGAGTQGQVAYYAANGTAVLGTSSIFINTNGNVGIGSTTPNVKLSIQGGAIIATGNVGNATAVSGTGTRMMWIPSKSAFRAGAVDVTGGHPWLDGTQWDDANIGDFSIGLGRWVSATGTGSVALGGYTTAGGLYAFASGVYTVASGDYSTAMGSWTNATGKYFSTAMGYGTTASGYYSATAMGYNTTASGTVSFAAGDSNVAGGATSTVFGQHMIVAGDGSFGINLASATQTVSAANVMVIMGGNVGINTTSPAWQLSVAGDINASGTFRINDFDYGQYFIATSGNSGDVYFSNGSGRGQWVPTGSLGFASSSGSNSYIQNQSASDQSASFRISGNGFIAGNVSIGTTTPAGQTLSVNGTLGVKTLTISDQLSGVYRIAGTNINNQIQLYDNTNNYTLEIYNGATEGVRLAGSGTSWINGSNVGIGTTSPAYKLDVYGDVNTTGTYRINGTDYGQYFIATSGNSNNIYMSNGSGRGYWTTTSSLGISGGSMPSGSAGQMLVSAGGTTWNATNSLFIAANGNVGINSTSPLAKLSVQDGSVLFNGNTGGTPVSGAGTRMMWVPSKAAFRAGLVDAFGPIGGGVEWNNAYIGDYSIAMGYDTVASGTASMAVGYGSVAGEEAAFAAGEYSSAMAFSSIAMGYQSVANGNLAVAIGRMHTVNGVSALALGSNMTVNGDSSVGIGLNYSQSFTVATSNVMAIMGGKVGIGTTSPAQTLDVVGNISNITQSGSGVAQITTVSVGSLPSGIFVSGKYAYVTNQGDQTISIVDISNPSVPKQVSNTALSLASPSSVYVSGRYAYVGNISGSESTVSIVDVSNPTAPVEIATTSAGGVGPGSIYVAGQYAYTANWYGQSISIIDVSNPAAPRQIATTSVGNNPSSIYVSGRYAYVANSADNTISVVDISNPSSPAQIATTSVGSSPYSIYVSGRYAYTANGTANNMSVVDISNPYTPVQVGVASLGANTRPNSVFVSGRYAYLTDSFNGENTISIVDITSSTAPAAITKITVGNRPGSVYVSGRYAYVTNFIGGNVSVVDISGTEVTSLIAHAAEFGNLQSRNDIFAQGNIMAGTSLSVGAGGIMSQGSVGVSVATGTAMTIVNGAILAKGTAGITPASGAGTRLMWTPSKAAFRAGAVGVNWPGVVTSTGAEWDDANIGNYSAAFGMDNISSGVAAFTTGIQSTSTGPAAVAMGMWNISSGTASIALGSSNIAGRDGAVAIGSSNRALNNGNIAIGGDNYTSGQGSMAFGYYNTSTGQYSTAMGVNMAVSGNYSFGIGLSAASFSVTQANVMAIIGGNVGIGTTSPAWQLSVKGDINATGTLRINDYDYGQYFIATSGNSNNIYMSNGSGRGHWVPTSSLGISSLPSGSAGQMLVSAGGTTWNATSSLFIAVNGNVGIGTTTPQALLTLKDGAILAEGTTGVTPIEGAGTRLMWVPSKAAFRAGSVDSTQWNNTNIGQNSFASGYNTTASGNYSNAMGQNAHAIGFNSFAMGDTVTASGTWSIAMGSSLTAGGFHSTAMGRNIEVSGQDSFGIGLSNSDNGTLSADNTFGVFNGAIIASGTIGNTPGSGPGTRMMWVPGKAAFRAGSVGDTYGGLLTTDGTEWDDANIGQYSAAFGIDNIAAGLGSFSVGIQNTSTNLSSIAMGLWNLASGTSAIALGSENTARGDSAIAIGNNNRVLVSGAMAFGAYNYVSGYASRVFGIYTTTTGQYSTAMGRYMTVSAENSFGINLGSSNAESGILSNNQTFGIFNGAILASGTIGNTPGSGAGTRLMWIPSKAAFRAGYVTGTSWDNGNIGNYSAAIGFSTMASGTASFAAGSSTRAWGNYSAAFGESSFAGGTHSFVSGYNAQATGNGGIALGTFSAAFGYDSKAIGTSMTVYGDYAVGIGGNMTIEGSGTRSIGLNATSTSNSIDQANTIAMMADYVGINTTTPTEKLDVNGSINISAGNYYKYNGVYLAYASTTLLNYFFGNAGDLAATGTGNLGAGEYALAGNAGGSQNTAYGLLALRYNDSADRNTAVGAYALYSDTGVAAGGNTAVGHSAGYYSTTGNSNVFVGAYAGQGQADYSGANQNTIIGYEAGSLLSSGSVGNVFLGYRAGYNEMGSNKLYISNYYNSDTPLIYGDFSTSRVGINTTTLPSAFVVVGTSTLQDVIPGGPYTGNMSAYNLGASTTRWNSVWAGVVNIGTSSFSIAQNGTNLGFYNQPNGAGTNILNFNSSGYVGIGTTTPPESLTIYRQNLVAAGEVTISGLWGSSATTTAVTGTGTRMLWIPGKAAFRVGSVGGTPSAPLDGTSWDNQYIGYYSFAAGYNTTASGTASFAVNNRNIASGQYSAAFGNTNIASGPDAFATGFQTQASGTYALSLGWSTVASGGSSIAGGYASRAMGNYTLAFGNTAIATGTDSIALGLGAKSEGDYSLALGQWNYALGQRALAAGYNNTVLGDFSSAVGSGNMVTGSYSHTMGQFNKVSTSYSYAFGYMNNVSGTNAMALGSYLSVNGNNTIGVGLGTGSYTVTADSAFVVMGGRVGIATSSPSTNYALAVTGNVGVQGNIFASGVITPGSSIDLAERYRFDSACTLAGNCPSAGDLVCLKDGSISLEVEKCSVSYNKKVIGIVSTDPGFLLTGGLDDSNSVAVALSGRVPVKVSASNGAIHAGDKLASSIVPGIAVLATEEGTTVGTALEDYSGPGTSTIMVYTSIGWNNKLYRGLSLDEENHKLIFPTTSIFESQVGNFSGARAFVFNAINFDTSTADKYILSLRSNNEPVFSVSANGDVNAKGNYYGASAILGTSTNPGDLAERVDIAIDDNVEAGDVMMVDPNAPDTYRRTTNEYEQTVAGVISTNPTLIVGNGKTDYKAIMAMVGRVPVKVTNINGTVKRGDLLVASAVKGYAMKYDATKDASNKLVSIIGIALENEDETYNGKVTALIRTGWIYNRDNTISNIQNHVQEIASAAGISLSPDTAPGNLTVGNSGGQLNYSGGILNLNNNPIINVSAIIGSNNKWKIDEDGNLTQTIATASGDREVYGMKTTASGEIVISGTSTLENGTKRVLLSDLDQAVIDKNVPLKIMVTPGGETKGVYIYERSFDGFTVKENENGTSNAPFDWTVIAKVVTSTSAVTAQVPVTPPPTEPASPSEPAPATPPADTTPVTEPAPTEPTGDASVTPAPSEPAPSEPAPTEPTPTAPADDGTALSSAQTPAAESPAPADSAPAPAPADAPGP